MRHDAATLRDFARMCAAMEKIARPESVFSFAMAGGLAADIATKLEAGSITMAEQANSIEFDVAQRGLERPVVSDG